ncbi:hypothetical protein D3C85_1242010 [compost metagenome]
MFTQVLGQTLAGLLDARRAGAQNDADSVSAIGLDRLLDVIANLQRRFQQQLVVAGGMQVQRCRDRCQFAPDRGHRKRALGDPAGLGAHA